MGRLIVREKRRDLPQTYELDIISGESRRAITGSSNSHLVEQLPRLRSLVDSAGRKFVYDARNTRHLEFVDSGIQRVEKELESFPHDLNIVGDLAVFNFASGGSYSSGGGEVYAYDLKQKRLIWEFDA